MCRAVVNSVRLRVVTSAGFSNEPPCPVTGVWARCPIWASLFVRDRRSWGLVWSSGRSILLSLDAVLPCSRALYGLCDSFEFSPLFVCVGYLCRYGFVAFTRIGPERNDRATARDDGCNELTVFTVVENPKERILKLCCVIYMRA